MEIQGIGNKDMAASVSSSKAKAADSSFEKHLENAMNKNEEQELKKVCKEFEGILINMMYKQMRASVPKSDLLPGDVGRDVFESMLDEKLTEEASKGRGIGLADVLYKQLSKQLKSKEEADKAENLAVDGNK